MATRKKYKPLVFIPEAKLFGELRSVNDHGEITDFDVNDGGSECENLDSKLQADSILLSFLMGFNDRQKIVLLYQVLREAGYNLNHNDCAKTLSLSRENYMASLREVRNRSLKVYKNLIKLEIL